MDLIPLFARAQVALALGVGALLAPVRASRRPPPLRSLQRILVVRLDELGDLVLSTAFLRELRSAAPEARITLVAQPGIADVLAGSPYVDKVISYDIRCRRALRPFVLPLRALAFALSRLRPLRAELAILPRWDADQCYATFLVRFAGATARVGYSHEVSAYKRRINAGYDSLLTYALDERGVRHEVDRSLALLRAIGGETLDDRTELTSSSEADASAEVLLGGAVPASATRWVAISPSYGHSRLKQWPTSHFVQLARLLVARGDLRLVIVGAAADRELARPIMEAAGVAALDLTGLTSLQELPAVLARCAVFVGADTGAMHVAAAVGTPTIGLMGPTNVVRFAPWHQDVLTVSLPCSPLRRAPEEDRCRTCLYPTTRCMAELTPQMAYDAVVRRLEGSPEDDALTPLPASTR